MGVVEKINALFANKYTDETITFDMLKELPLYSWQGDIYGIKYMKVYDADGIIAFNTTIKKGCSFECHQHDCEEEIFVIDGFLKDKKHSFGIVSGETIKYGSFIPHQPYAVRDTVISVIFRKTKK